MRKTTWVLATLSTLGLLTGCDDEDSAAISGLDAGQIEADAGTIEGDAGQIEADAGQIEADAGQIEADAGLVETMRSSSASRPDAVLFAGSRSVEGAVYEIMPGPAALMPEANPTPFSNNTNPSAGSYSLTVSDVDSEDSMESSDAVTSVEIRFTGSNGVEYLIDEIAVIHKPLGAGDHSFMGGVGSNVTMHGDTGLGTNMMPKMLSYITLWGIADLKNADGEVLEAGRVIHIMTGTRVRNADLELATDVERDGSDHATTMAETHVILPPTNMAGEMAPMASTAHGFLHMMFEQVELTEPSRDPKLVYEILPGPAALNPEMSPTPFSNRTAVGAGSYTLSVRDVDAEDSMDSQDAVDAFTLSFISDDGTTYTADGIDIIHKPLGAGDHSFFGGVGLDKLMHGDSGVGTGLMPKMTAYITLWGLVDLMDAEGTVVAPGRVIHIMVGSRTRTDDLELITDTANDATDPSPEMVETHIILPPQNMAGEMAPVPGTRHGFLHLMFEKVSLSD